MAFTAVGAIIAGEAVTATVVLAAVAEVGMALTVVGAVTGSKDLMKIGGAMSLIGGVGGMVAGSMSAGTAAAGATEAGLGEAATSAALDAASTEAMSAYGGYAGAEAATADVVAGMEGAAQGAAGGLGASGAQQGIFNSAMEVAPSTTEAVTTGTMPVGPQAEMTVNDVPGAQTPAGAQGPATPYDTPNPTDMRLAAGTQGPQMPGGANAPEASGSFFKRLSTFANNNKTLFSSGLQLVGGAMKGANESSMWNEKMALERQRLAQTGYGNQVGIFAPRGIVQGAGQ